MFSYWPRAIRRALTETLKLFGWPQVLLVPLFFVVGGVRSLQTFLVRALENLYAINRERAAEVVSRLRIFHPYGSVGKLSHARGQPGVQFGDRQTSLLNVALGIKTYGEKLEETDSLIEMRNEIAQAQSLIFLGMHFHSQNLRLITPPNPITRRIFATALGRSEADREVIRKELSKFIFSELRGNALGKPNRVRVDSLKCSDLFDTYSKSLAQ